MLTMCSSQRDQQLSPLLRLPAELCDKIYEYVLGGYNITFYGGRAEVWSTNPAGYNGYDGSSNVLALQSVCRQLCNETRSLFYSFINEFEITYFVPVGLSLLGWLLFSTSISVSKAS